MIAEGTLQRAGRWGHGHYMPGSAQDRPTPEREGPTPSANGTAFGKTYTYFRGPYPELAGLAPITHS